MNPAKPWNAEYAKSSRASCRSCKNAIAKDTFRLARIVPARGFDGFMQLWNHASCILKKANQIKSTEDVEGFDSLRWEDQQKIRKYVEEGAQETSSGTQKEYSIEISPSSRTNCKKCSDKIIKGTVRVLIKPDGQGAKGSNYYHIRCLIDSFPSCLPEKFFGWDDLPVHEREELSVLINEREAAKKEGSKRKRAVVDDDGEKLSKTEERVSDRDDFESRLKLQSNQLWAIKDELKRHMTNAEIREMLDANGQDSSGSEYDLRERCADGMLFGALAKCPLCSGSLYYLDSEYRCRGYVSAWSKCSYSTTQPVRLRGKWKIPEGTENQYLLRWFKTQKVKKPERVLPRPSDKPPVQQISSTSSEELGIVKVVLTGNLRDNTEDWKKKLANMGVDVLTKIGKGTSCLVVSELDQSDPEIKKARRMKVPIVREGYLADCVKTQKKLPLDAYKIDLERESQKGRTVTVKVKGRSAVHESSGLQDSGHILEDGKSIFSTTLNLSDLSTGVNSYYILQVIEEDGGQECYVFRKWGRVGNEKIGGKKLEQMSKSDAIDEFQRLFLEKTGNSWKMWELKNFVKQPGRFCPLDIDYGVKEMPRRKDSDDSESKLAPQLVALMKMLFDIETYRAAMMEFDINMSEMPLGKLSKENIQKGFEALTEIQNLLTNVQSVELSVKKSMIIDASNRFFTLIPSVHPRAIMDMDDFKAKVKMLEALQDIEIASRLVGFDTDCSEPLDEKYNKLHCNISPLDHDCEDYKLVEKYLCNTHAPTHKDWELELEDVFALEREGEFDRYASHRDRLQNKMLLWHGSRVTNFVGILSQGLRIAPPEAPVTGYMFGKGIYFADLVSKSAQYCFTDKKSPVGLLLLSEVALGETHELKKATYVEQPPEGKMSTKGLGKTAPDKSEFVIWRDQVVVPCGKPVRSSIRASELLYNEYIVYDTTQVKMQFLVKVRFHHKR
ncbi:poly(ADP-ribose) polymerase 2 [Wolffia australiana]